jgi:hypothetical protein
MARDFAGGGGDLVPADFAHTDDVAISGGDENFIGGVEIFGAQRVLEDGNARFWRDFKEDAAGDAFQAAGIQWGRVNLAVLNGENVSCGAFGDFAALIEENDFVETFLLRFGDGPNIWQPGDAFYSGEGRRGVAAVRAEGKADGLAIFGKRRRIDDEIDLRLGLVTAPEADLVVDEIDTRAALGDMVGANDFVKMHANFGRSVGQGHADKSGVFFKAAPVAFISEGFAAGDANGGEQAPAAEKAGLSGRQADLLDGEQAIVVKDVAVNQREFLALYSSEKTREGRLERQTVTWAGGESS